MKNALLLFSLAYIFFTCNQKPKVLFSLLSEEQTGIRFSNDVIESDSFNIITFEYIYNGGGVGIGDFNNDGFSDIFFSGNMVPNKLYLNMGSLKFTDITHTANVGGEGMWSSGVSVVDINNDGWLDIYVSTSQRNLLFLNRALGVGKIPIFDEKATNFGIDYSGHSVMSSFFDYDRDGDLDLYILTNKKSDNSTAFKPKIVDGTSINNDVLLRNEGNGSFFNVTIQAGIKEEGYGLGLAISDFNLDGWADIYVSNDFLTNDILYVNNKNGTFSNATEKYIGHQSKFSMGNDVADINNDQKPDLITLDMLPENNERIKTTIGNKSYTATINSEKYGYQLQYVRNMLHLNNGLSEGIKFSEIGQLAGIHQTEWSWSPLFVDVDNDGFKDLLVANGFPKDITDKDFVNYRSAFSNIASVSNLLESIPVVKIPNYAFKNMDGLSFVDMGKQWGLNIPSFSNGASFADLDNDGDLDYVVNNINEVAFIYENRLNNAKSTPVNNYLNVRLLGDSKNIQAIGSKISVFYDSGKVQYSELNPYRGYLSSVEPVIHFGLGKIASVDSARIVWPDNTISKLFDVKVNQTLFLEYGNVEKNEILESRNTGSKLFSPLNNLFDFKHQEVDQNDFIFQRTLPHKFSQYGPSVAIGDINNDGLEDVVIGCSAGSSAYIYKQQSDGSFSIAVTIGYDERGSQDGGILLFDIDNDDDLDLYIVRGGLAQDRFADILQDHLYINDGEGNFVESSLPLFNSSGSCARAADFDSDGDLDLFVGGRVLSLKYPISPRSYLFQNDNGSLIDVTDKLAPELQNCGMVTDALWTDYNNDGFFDLLVVGEFMPVTFFRNDGGRLSKLSNNVLDKRSGWWNSIGAGDFDQDGDTDYVVGNLGANNNYRITDQTPLTIMAKDFDENGSIDPIMIGYLKESMYSDRKRQFPLHFWDELNSQSPLFRNKFRTFREYSLTDIDQLLSNSEKEGALILEANTMLTSIIENLGNGHFRFKSLQTVAQVAPTFGIIASDFNGDTFLDLAMVGNDYGNEVFAGRYDAFTGLVLLGDGKLNFTPVPSSKSGFYVPYNAKGLVLMNHHNEPMFVATQNRDSLKSFALSRAAMKRIFTPNALDASGILNFKNGKKQKIEFYYGSGFHSQSTRSVFVSDSVDFISIEDYSRNSRNVTP